MLLSDLINQTASVLPLFTDKFTSNKDITSVSKTGDTVTVTVNSHSLIVGEQVILSGVKTDVQITNITTSNGIATATCAVDHDLTQGFTLKAEISSAEPSYNGRFDILSVISSNEFTFRVSGAPSDNTGTLKTFHNIGFNGVATVTNIVDANNFEFTLVDDRLTTGSGDNMRIMSRPRISGAATLNRAITSYTSKKTDELWGLFVFQGMDTSNDRSINNDSKNERQRLEEFKLRLINDVTFYVFIPTHEDISGRFAVDLAQDLARPIYKTLAGYETSNVFTTCQQTVLMPSSHNIIEEYETPFLIYGYDFQNTEFMLASGESTDLDQFMSNSGDVFTNFYTSAFRKYDLNTENRFDEIVKMNEFKILD